jgi:hypothetical protein
LRPACGRVIEQGVDIDSRQTICDEQGATVAEVKKKRLTDSESSAVPFARPDLRSALLTGGGTLLMLSSRFSSLTTASVSSTTSVGGYRYLISSG